jgi:hypothetical protein
MRKQEKCPFSQAVYNDENRIVFMAIFIERFEIYGNVLPWFLGNRQKA